jgi:diguanylate cyclase (GGDEF)-like protein
LTDSRTGLRIPRGLRAKSARFGVVQLKLGNPFKYLLAASAALLLLLAAACALLPRSLALTAVSDIVGGVLMLLACVAFTLHGFRTSGRLRLFWLLQAAGWALWFSDQMVWLVFDLILQKKMPSMSPADALLFLAGAPMIAGVLLRPHRQPSTSSSRLGVLDFLLLLLWWLYIYVAFVVCWQYPSPNEPIYSRNYDSLSAAETILLTGILLMFWRESSGRWRRFYGLFCGAAVFNGIAFYVINHALETGIYYTGSWYDVPYCASFTFFTAIPLWGENLSPAPENAADESYNSWMANLAMTAVLSLPIIAFLALLSPSLPKPAASFRVLVTIATMFLMAALLFIQHRRLNRELQRANVVLQEASLTDPLTGLRNRRYFSATIEGDVEQSLRSHADNRDSHTRDLVFYLIDADNFKEVNDRYGHDVGDKVLVEMAQRLSSSIRHSDVLVRWGGEEFLIVSRYTDRADAEWLAQRVLAAVGDKPFSLGDSGKTMHRTCSLGWVAFPWLLDNPRAVRYEEVLTLADRALHRAKESGRNCAVGMLPASGKLPATRVAGLNANALEVDVLAIAGPHPA